MISSNFRLSGSYTSSFRAKVDSTPIGDKMLKEHFIRNGGGVIEENNVDRFTNSYKACTEADTVCYPGKITIDEPVRESGMPALKYTK